ncbi:hypothetical protein J437_LFUL004760 [Ladona fulva]|uniref:Protein SPT2 homolog n=1 Tax=Ladona fulva TaxID=123851 RepID=A0A8K0NXN6_LADFU|nr:hypothetical protein J437_LFUL004760 [Ladona fulva]
MTKKQKEEYLREKQYRQRREEMAKAAAAAKSKEKSQTRSSESQMNNSESKSNSSFKTPSIPRIPKLNGAKANPDQNRVSASDNEARRSSVPQQTESREGISDKKRMAEGAKPGSARPPSSSREQERMTSEVKRNSMQHSSRTYETDRKPIQSVPSPKERKDKVEIEGRKQPANHTLRPVMKEEQRHSTQLSKTAAVREERPVNSQSSRPVMKDDRRMSNQPQRPKEELRPSPASREPPKSLKPVSSLTSKPNRPLQGSVGTKPSQNVMKKVEGKSATPVAGDMLRERLSNCSNQSLPQKSQPGSSQMVKKDLKMRPPEKSKNTAPSTETSLPKGVPSRLSGATPSGGTKEKMKSLPPERKPETSAVNKKPQMDDRRPSVPERKPCAVAERGPTGDRRPPSMVERRPLSMSERRPPAMGDRRPFAARGRPMHPQDARRRPPAKRRIESDDEYDSELDDFIDDGPEEGEDYSKYIKEIFGYDKSRYRGRDFEDDDEDECMESSFSQQMKEEYVSTKLGILEDLEDIKKEQMEKMKKKKMMMATKKKKL